MFQLIKAIVSNINDQWPNDRWHGNAATITSSLPKSERDKRGES